MSTGAERSVVDRGLPQSCLVTILTFLPDERERISATRTSKAFLSVRGSYETGGKLWKRLRRIGVRTGAVVDRIAFHFSDGSRAAYGGDGSSARDDFVIDPDDEVVALRCREGDALYCVEFITKKGRSVAYGRPAGRIRSPDGAYFREGRWKTFGGTVVLDLGAVVTAERLWGNVCVAAVEAASDGRGRACPLTPGRLPLPYLPAS